MNWRLIVVICLCLISLLGSGIRAQDDINCPGAPPPRLLINGEGRVTAGNANNMRDIAARSGTKIGVIAAGEVFSVLEGPICADGFNWWRVTAGNLTGWMVEGQGADYWAEPVNSNGPAKTPAPTETPSVAAVSIPARRFEPPRPVINILESGVKARVISDDPTSADIRLTLRSEAGLKGNTVTQLTAGTLVTVLDGVQEMDNLIWREIKTTDGRQGWAAEGFWNDQSAQYERTLLPICPVIINRIAFYMGRYIYTANRDGTDACVMDRLILPEQAMNNLRFLSLANRMIWSPDHSAFAYIDLTQNNMGRNEAFLLSADGAERRQLTQDSDVWWLDWSPDSKRLLFAQTIGENVQSQRLSDLRPPQIWTMRPDGTAYGALTTGDNRKPWAAWLADSETLLYVENIGERRNQIGPTPQEFIFYTVNVKKGGLTELYRTTLNISRIELSPDRSQLVIQGREIALTEGTEFYEFGASQSIILNIETGEAALLPDDIPHGLIWLPDGSGLISLNADQLIIVPVSGADPSQIPLSRPIMSSTGILPIEWLPDGQIAVLSIGDNQLAAVDVKDGTVTTLIGTAQPN